MMKIFIITLETISVLFSCGWLSHLMWASSELNEGEPPDQHFKVDPRLLVLTTPDFKSSFNSFYRGNAGSFSLYLQLLAIFMLQTFPHDSLNSFAKITLKTFPLYVEDTLAHPPSYPYSIYQMLLTYYLSTLFSLGFESILVVQHSKHF